jgi:hypothetical protein
LRHGSHHAQPVAEAGLGGQGTQPFLFLCAGAASERPAGDQEMGIRQATVCQQTDGTDGRAQILERLDARGGEHQWHVGRQAERPAGRGAVARGELGEVDATWDGVDARSGAIVQPAQLCRLQGSGGDDGIHARQHLLFQHGAALVCGRPDAGHATLDLRQRMEHVHRRHAPAPPQAQRHQAGEPVMAVDHVVRLAVDARKGDHSGGEQRDKGQQVVGRHRLQRAGVDLNDTCTGSQLDHRRGGGVRTAGEDVHLQIPARKGHREGAHVDVQAAGVALARLGQRAGVQRDESNVRQHSISIRLSCREAPFCVICATLCP